MTIVHESEGDAMKRLRTPFVSAVIGCIGIATHSDPAGSIESA